MRAWLSSVLLQARLIAGSPDYLSDLATAPLFTIIFLAVLRTGDRLDLVGRALVAPALMATWAVTVRVSGEILDGDRRQGMLPLLVATPRPLWALLLSRVAPVGGLGLIAFLESWVVGRLLFGVTVELHHPAAFAAGVVATWLGVTTCGLLFSGLFVLTRSARTLQNSLTYPLFLLSGLVFPPSLLPDPLEQLSNLVFLSWSSALLGGALQPGPLGDAGRMVLMIVLLSVAQLVIGLVSLRLIVRRVRNTATLEYA
jgi:ABC-2 type transport system permease protein